LSPLQFDHGHEKYAVKLKPGGDSSEDLEGGLITNIGIENDITRARPLTTQERPWD